MPSPTFASFLTPEGIIVAGALITGLIQLLKTSIPAFDARVSGALAAFVISLVLYVITAAATGANTPDLLLTVFASWLACATASVGVYAAANHVATNR